MRKLSWRVVGIIGACVVAGLALALGASTPVRSSALTVQATLPLASLEAQLQVGDVVFIRVPHLLYRKVAEANQSWTNHVGIVVDVGEDGAIVAESRVPRAGETTFKRFVARSENGRVAVRRLPRELGVKDKRLIAAAARQRFGQWYDLGFNLQSSRQFCSKFVREVLQQATGVSVGKVETFSSMLAQHPEADQRFWKWWYLGAIPWQRLTVTPASQYESPALESVFDGEVVTQPSQAGHNSRVAHNPF